MSSSLITGGFLIVEESIFYFLLRLLTTLSDKRTSFTVITRHTISSPSLSIGMTGEVHMHKQVTKANNIFWAPGLDVARSISDSDVAAAIQAAEYRFSASMRSLEAAFEQKASELRAAFLKEVQDACGEAE
jgi:hypothetical protein